MNARFILDDDDVLQVSLSAGGQLVDPLRSAGTETDGEFERITVSSVSNIVTIQVAMETLYEYDKVKNQGI